MPSWKPKPSIYQINTAVWLTTLSRRFGRQITLRNIPDNVYDELAELRVDAIWMMGVWTRGPLNRASALNYIHEYRSALPDVQQEDIIGSAYAIGAYRVDDAYGGHEGLATFRKRIYRMGMRLMLDFVPNHVGLDHPWLKTHPEYFIQGNEELLHRDRGNFFAFQDDKGQKRVYAHGKDPNFPGWIDTAQLNAFSVGYRQAAIDTLLDLAAQCDGVRCDMAMLLQDDVFMRTWGWRGVTPLPETFWRQVIGAVRAKHPHFLFIAEVYWSREYAMLQEGFDYTYDKTMYDRIVANDVDGLYAHLSADIRFLKRNIRFIENHDEPRAATAIGLERQRPAAVLIATTPGALLLHDGQFVGRRAKLPVQIKRQPEEEADESLRQFYLNLLREAGSEIYRYGDWTLFPRYASGTHSHRGIMAYGWHLRDSYRLIVLNLSGERAQAIVDMSAWSGLFNHYDAHLQEIVKRTHTYLQGTHIARFGWTVDLGPYEFSIYQLRAVPKKRATATLPALPL
ncbi:MAG: alpha-amylase family glycosyl hydrolase [Anaerolineae bacterium]|nr:alpha-amylase family glycosyl hydrolase [Anaerolineae bacterium]